MADTAKRLAGPAGVATTAGTVYTVPTATTTVVRNVHVVNTSATQKLFRMSIGTMGTGTAIWYDLPIPGNASFDWTGIIVMTAAEVIQTQADVLGLTATISGVEVA